MRVAVIGLGAISVNHLSAIQNEKAEIVALCDIVYEKCKNTAEKLGLTNTKLYTDYKQMIDSEKLDVVHICTPHYLHAEMICYALNKNVNVFSEKPLAISYGQLAEIEKAVKSSKAILGVSQQNRYNPAVLYVKDYIKDKKVVSASGLLAWCRDKAYYNSGEWRGKWATEGGGVMINQALHTLDLLQWFTGFPKYCTATTSNLSLKDIIEVEDTAFGVFECENGSRFVVNATNSLNDSFSVQIMLHTDNDTILLDGENLYINGEKITVKQNGKIVGKSVWGASHFTIIKDFYEKIQSGKKFPLGYYEAEKVIKLILAMYASKGEKIEIK